MAESIDQRPGQTLRKGGNAPEDQVRALQRGLRQLGYLRNAIDGLFGNGTQRAIKALQHDLLHNDGRSRVGDGEAPVRVLDYNRGRVVDITGEADTALLACMTDMLEDPAFPKLPRAEDPAAENRRIGEQIAGMRSTQVPMPFVRAILEQESNLRHYQVPRGRDEDDYIVVGLDTNASKKHIITSRGYGAGQYTLFHHPPRPEEVEDFMLDVSRNLGKAMGELREKFDHFVNGPSSGTRADDRIAEFGDGPLRVCRYAADDERYLFDCRQCAKDAGFQTIEANETPYYEGASGRFRPTQYYRKASYSRVPVRGRIGCDWPYAVRRYNGAGVNSYHYQARILKKLLK